jgi:hypothetical protein
MTGVQSAENSPPVLNVMTVMIMGARIPAKRKPQIMFGADLTDIGPK